MYSLKRPHIQSGIICLLFNKKNTQTIGRFSKQKCIKNRSFIGQNAVCCAANALWPHALYIVFGAVILLSIMKINKIMVYKKIYVYFVCVIVFGLLMLVCLASL